MRSVHEQVLRALVSFHQALSRRPELGSWSLRREWPWPFTIALGLFLFYAWCSPRTVALEDDGLFVMASHFGGIAHPPGYPVFTLLGHLFSQLPFGSVAWRVHLVSALFGGLACAVLWCIVRGMVRSRLIATCAALAYGLSEAFWSQAIIAEVYTLNAFLTFMLVYMLLHLSGIGGRSDAVGRDGISWQAAVSLGLLCGLGLSNHWPLIVLFAPAYLILAWPVITALMRRWLPILSGLCLGLLPYIWLYLRSLEEPAISYAGPIEGWSEFLSFVSRSAYASADHEAGVVWADKLAYMRLLGHAVLDQLTVVGACLALVGLVSTKRGIRTTVFGLLLGAGGVSILLVWLLDREFSLLGGLVFRVYPIPAYGVMAILVGLALDAIWERIRAARSITFKKGLQITTAMLVPVSSLVAHGGQNFRMSYSWAERYAEAVLDELPRDASILLRSDVEVFAVGYVQMVRGHRSDLRLHAPGGRVFFGSARLPTDPSEAGPWETALKESSGKALGKFCFVGIDEPTRVIDKGLVLNGLTSCYSADNQRGRATLQLTPRVLSRLLAVQVDKSYDAWTKMAIDVMNAQLMPVLLRARAHASAMPGPWVSALDAAIRNALAGVTGKLAYLEFAHREGGAATIRSPVDILTMALGQIDEAPTKSVIVKLYLHASMLSTREGGITDPEEFLWKAVKLQPILSNPALPPLLTRLFQSGKQETVIRLASLSGDLRSVANLYELFVRDGGPEFESITIREPRGSLTVDASGKVSFE